MKKLLAIAAFLLIVAAAALAQSDAVAEPPQFGDAITGMYSFVREGEFVQMEVSDGKVTGVLSRFKNDDPDSGEFVDQFFDQATLDGPKLIFRTKPVDGVWFEFSGVVERGSGKTPADEGYWNIRGTLTERHTQTDGSTTEKTSQLTLKSFPQDAEPASQDKQ
jgi:hypothetical protein